jgi:hypothetical protein
MVFFPDSSVLSQIFQMVFFPDSSVLSQIFQMVFFPGQHRKPVTAA